MINISHSPQKPALVFLTILALSLTACDTKRETVQEDTATTPIPASDSAPKPKQQARKPRKTAVPPPETAATLTDTKAPPVPASEATTTTQEAAAIKTPEVTQPTPASAPSTRSQAIYQTSATIAHLAQAIENIKGPGATPIDSAQITTVRAYITETMSQIEGSTILEKDVKLGVTELLDKADFSLGEAASNTSRDEALRQISRSRTLLDQVQLLLSDAEATK